MVSAVVVAVAGAVVVVGTVAVMVLWASSSSLSLVRVKDTFVGTPFGYQYLYPWEHSISVCLFAPNFLSRW